MTGRGGRKRWRREWSIWTGGKGRRVMGIRGNRESRGWVRNVVRGEGELVCRYDGCGRCVGIRRV